MAILTLTYNSGWSLLSKAESIASTYQDGPDALAAIVLSYSALEAFVSESEWLAGREQNNVALSELAVFLEALEANHAPIRNKLDAVALKCTAKKLEWGRSPFQDLSHLKLLRDWAVHPKPVVGSSGIDVEDSREAKFFIDRGLLDERHVGNHVVWSSVVLVQPVAGWACGTVRAVITEMINILPDSDMTRHLRASWQRGMVPSAGA